MRIRGNGADSKRDLFPKTNLYDGHLGDAYPLCSDLPPRHFLAGGARFSYLGHSATARLQPEAIHEQTKTRLRYLEIGTTPRVVPSPETSLLYEQLCGNSAVGAPCNFRSELYLPSTLPCDGDECDISTVAVVDIYDPGTNRTIYYECASPFSRPVEKSP